MFTFIIFILMSALCFILYAYFSNKLSLQRKQIIVLSNQNRELKDKLNKIKLAQTSSDAKNNGAELTNMDDELL